MASIRDIVFLLSFLFLLANTGVSVPIFRAKGQNIEMGYCFGVDYIVVFRSSPQGDQLLGNSSEDAATTLLPNDLQGRVTITNHEQLLGLQISQLQHSDSGVYRRECWQNEELVNQHEHDLSVCEEELDSREIILMEDGDAVLLCNSSTIGLKGSTIRWYYDVPPLYELTLFLDSNVSLVPLIEELQEVVEVQRGGAALRVPYGVLQDTQHFYCLVLQSQNCLSFQDLNLPDSDNHKIIIATKGERVVMVCPSAHKSLVQRWDTPLGMINRTTVAVTATEENVDVNSMHLLNHGASGNYSLVIPVVSEKHTGHYSCFAPSMVVEYTLIICSKMTSRKITFSLGEEVSFKCNVSEDGSEIVQWFQRGAQGEAIQMFNSIHNTTTFPKDLSGRVRLNEEGSTLHLSSVNKEDVGEYWCSVLTSIQYDLDYDYDNTNIDEDYTEEYVYDSNESQWSGMQCISKQVTYLILSDTTPPETAPPRTTIYVAAAVLAGLALVAVIVVVIVVLKRRAKRPLEQKAEERAMQPMTSEPARNPKSLMDKSSSEEPDNS